MDFMNSLDRNTPILTIGIPTFNRSEAVCTRLQELITLEMSNQIQILVIDNHSTDGTAENLNKSMIPSHMISKVQIISNESNLGFVGNFFSLFDHCRTEYLLVCSDEDQIIESGLQRLLEFLGERSPDFVSPQAEVRGQIYRGRKKIHKLDYLQHEEASFYISGLCFKIESAQKFLERFPDLVKNNSLVEVYPQTALAGFLLAEGNGFWLDTVVTRQLNELPSHIVHSDGGAYFHLCGRFEQLKGSISLADLIISNELLRQESRDSIIRYKELLNEQLFQRMRTALFYEYPEMMRHFDKGARRYYLFSWLTRFYGSRFSTLVGRLTPSLIRRILRRLLR